MKYADCISIKIIDFDTIIKKKPKICKANIKFFLINEPQKLLNTLERDDHFSGIGIIELDVEYFEYPNEIIRITFSEVKGLELDPENELEYLITYGKAFLIDELQPKLDCPVTINEPINHFVAVASNGDQWFIST